MKDFPKEISFVSKKWGYLRDFIKNSYKGEEFLSIVPEIDCISIEDNQLNINDNNCIKCLFCCSGMNVDNISIDNEFNILLKKSESITQTDFHNQVFTGELIQIPCPKTFLSQNYSSLRQFTETHETKHLSVWAAKLISSLASQEDPRLGLELNMLIQTRDRGGRLDICLLSNNNLFTIESKVSFTKMMQENRFLSQMLAYKEEIANTISASDNQNIKPYTILLVDGRESDLLFSSHPKCTSRTGSQSDIFYKIAEDNKIFFISSTAIWALALKRIFSNDRNMYSLDNVLDKIYDKSLGLLSGGVVQKRNGKFVLLPLDDDLK